MTRSHSNISLKYTMELQERRGQRRPAPEIDGRSLPRRTRRRTEDDPCDLCKSMFSRKGLQSLNSVDGLRHHTRAGCIASRDEGCKICKFIFLAVCKDHDGDWDEDGHLVFRNNHPQKPINYPGIYGLQCSLEGGLTDHEITIDTFAKEGLCSSAHC